MHDPVIKADSRSCNVIRNCEAIYRRCLAKGLIVGELRFRSRCNKWCTYMVWFMAARNSRDEKMIEKSLCMGVNIDCIVLFLLPCVRSNESPWPG